MRRPVFDRWAKGECRRLAGGDAFSLPRFAALAQSPTRSQLSASERKRLAAALHLYALAAGCEGRLLAHVWDKRLAGRYAQASKAIGARDVQRLALRGTPLLSLPVEYRNVLQAFHDAYHAPEIAAERKRELQAESRELQLRAGVSCSDIARATGIAATNVSGYLSSGKAEKVSLGSAEQINAYPKARLAETERDRGPNA